MSDWNFLNKHRREHPLLGKNDASWGFNGYFEFEVNCIPIKVVASDGEGWQHVSVSLVASSFTASWDMMCKVKDLFWEPEDAVIQIHPPKSEYVNFHKGCLHLWRCIDGREQPLPHWILVGPKMSQKKFDNNLGQV